MAIDYVKYRQSSLEQARIADIIGLLPRNRSTVMDIGARDGFISQLLTDYFKGVTALDLEMPDFDFPGVIPVCGDVTSLQFSDDAFDVVCCLEVLEHIPPERLGKACREIVRVTRHEALIGVPYRQDIRIGRTTCSACGKHNPPWGHVNSFDEDRLRRLFAGMETVSITFVGQTQERTNPLSAFFLNAASNPWGSYDQEEPCLFCGKQLAAPARGTLMHRAFAHLAERLNRVQSRLAPPRPIWMHALLRKP